MVEDGHSDGVSASTHQVLITLTWNPLSNNVMATD